MPRLPRRSGAASRAPKPSPSAPPSAISATPATQNDGRCEVVPRLPRKVCVQNVCVYTVITNGFSSFHCSCTILKSRGQRYPCHFLCQRSWVTCGKDIDQGRLIYVPAIVSTVDFLFLFMSCALFLRSWICVRWNSIARQLKKSGEDYDILHTFYWPLPHSVSWVFDLTWSHRRLVSTNQKVMSGHFPVFRVEYESPKPYALRVHFKRHMTESRFYTVKSNRSSHKAK